MHLTRTFTIICVLTILAFAFGLSTGTYKHFPFPYIAAMQDIIFNEQSDESRSSTDRSRNSRVLRSKTHFEIFTPNVEVVMVGDSITDEGIWSEIFPEVRIANRGIWGDTTFDVVDRLDSITDLGAMKAFILLGVNDIAQGRDLEESIGNYMIIVEELQRHGTEVYIQSVIECSSPLCLRIKKEIREFNDALKSYASEKGIPFIDLNSTMAHPSTGLYSEFSNDGVHLLGQGYKAWSTLISQFIR